MGKRYCKTDLVQALQELEKKLGRTPEPGDLGDDPSASQVLGYFKNWNRALKAAGFGKVQFQQKSASTVQATKAAEVAPAPVVEPEEPCKNRYSKSIIRQMLVDECARLGKKPTRKEIDDNKELPTVSTILKYFETTRMGDVWKEVLGE